MKIKSIFPLLILLTFIACDPNGNKNNTDNKDQTENTDEEGSNNSPGAQAPSSENEENTAATENENKEEKPDHFICFTNDSNAKMAISIGYDKEDKALSVKYKGQKESMRLSFIKEEMTEGGAYPNIETYYSEMYEGKENGVYKITHAGALDYAEYTRGSDQKVFNFTIDHELSDDNGAYRSTPCF